MRRVLAVAASDDDVSCPDAGNAHTLTAAATSTVPTVPQVGRDFLMHPFILDALSALTRSRAEWLNRHYPSTGSRADERTLATARGDRSGRNGL